MTRRNRRKRKATSVRHCGGPLVDYALFESTYKVMDTPICSSHDYDRLRAMAEMDTEDDGTGEDEEYSKIE